MGEEKTSQAGQVVGDGSSDPAEYGETFAAVYDDWYGTLPGAEELLKALSEILPRPGRIIELGVGTGRVAAVLAAAGWEVIGIDASPAMLEHLSVKNLNGVRAHLGDAAAPQGWPNERVEVIAATYNFLLNLTDTAAQQRCVELAAEHLLPDGWLVVEHSELALPAGTRHTVSRSDASGTERTWQLTMLPTAELDQFAAANGLDLVRAWSDWSGAAATPHDAQTIRWYRKLDPHHG
jgi:SAM-dependent methyltransferase